MARVLFLGGTYSDLPLIESLKARHEQVFLLNNVPLEAVIHCVDGHIPVDYNDKEAVLATAKEYSVGYIVSGCNDGAYLTCAYVAEQLGLPGYDTYETALTLHHKDRFRTFMAANGLSTHTCLAVGRGDALSVEDVDGLGYPLIVKPVDRSGGKGIATVSQSTDLNGALLNALNWSNNGYAIVESLLPGELKSCSAFWVGGEFVFAYFDNEYLRYNPYQVSTSLAPLGGAVAIEEKLLAMVTAVAEKMTLVDGLIHTQFLLDGDDVHIIEITRRTPGDIYAVPVNLLTGVDYTALTLDGYMGQSRPDVVKKPVEGCVIRHCPAAPGNGRIRQYVIDPSLDKYLVKYIKYLDVGDEVVSSEFQRMGVFVLHFESKALAVDILSVIDDLIYVEVESPETC